MLDRYRPIRPLEPFKLALESILTVYELRIYSVVSKLEAVYRNRQARSLNSFKLTFESI